MCVLFALFEKKTQYQFKLSIYGFDIERVPCIKFSGVIIDDNFIRRQHIIENTSKEMSSSISILNLVRYRIDRKDLYSLYCTLVLPYT